MRTLFAVPTTLSCVHIYILIRKPAGSHGVHYRDVPLSCNVQVYIHTTYLFEGKPVWSSMVFPWPLVWLAVYWYVAQRWTAIWHDTVLHQGRLLCQSKLLRQTRGAAADPIISLTSIAVNNIAIWNAKTASLENNNVQSLLWTVTF